MSWVALVVMGPSLPWDLISIEAPRESKDWINKPLEIGFACADKDFDKTAMEIQEQIKSMSPQADQETADQCTPEAEPEWSRAVKLNRSNWTHPKFEGSENPIIGRSDQFDKRNGKGWLDREMETAEKRAAVE